MGDATEPNGTSNTIAPTPPAHSFATLGIHADDSLNPTTTDVAPALHTSTTYAYPHDPDHLIPEHQLPQGAPGDPPAEWVYSRYRAPNSSRLEHMLAQILNGPCLTYSSGLSAFHALLVYTNPKVVAIGDGYHGCHGVLKIFQKLTKCRIVDLFDEASWDEARLGEGDVVHLETPVNPTGTAFQISRFAEMAHKRGAVLTMDATFAPPPLQDPFEWGVDFVMHSGTKYFGGHSDMLLGVLAVNKKREGWEKDYWGLLAERNVLGSVPGNLEGWLGVRSLRTFELRIRRQSENAEALVTFLDGCINNAATTSSTGSADTSAVRKVVTKVTHASLQTSDMSWLRPQMPGGFGPVFALWCHSAEQAKRLPSKLHLFHHATSLGGVESLIEWRRMSDKGVDERLLRVSVGAEGWEDLREDLVGGFRALVEEGW